jgi:O-antigen ligase
MNFGGAARPMATRSMSGAARGPGRSPRRRGQAPPPPPDPLLHAESVCFLAATSLAIVGAPIAMGGRHPLGHAVLTLAALAALASWLIRAARAENVSWRLGVVDVLLVAALGIGILQAMPLPESVIRGLSPKLYALLPCLDGGPGSLWRWDRLSLAPGETLAGLGILLAQGTFLVILVQRIQSVAEVEPVLRVVAVATALLAALGLVQYLFGNGSYLWFYEFPHNDAGGVVKGTFTNRNHFAGFLATGIGATLWWALGREHGPGGPPARLAPVSDAAVGRWLVVAAVAFAAVSSLSRGGCLALAAAAAVCLAVAARSRAWRGPALLGGLGTAALVWAALAIHGQERLGRRFELLLDPPGSDALGGRAAVWRAAWSAMRDFPWLGTGVGTHADVSPLYMPPTGDVTFTHAENSYLNLGVETGFIGLAVAVVALATALAAAVAIARSGDDRERRVAAALGAGIVASGVHACVDFVWFVPACSMLALVLGCSAIGLVTARQRWLPVVNVPIGRPGALIAGTAVAVLLGGSGIRQLTAAWSEVAWERSIKEARAIDTAAAATPASQADEPPTDPAGADPAPAVEPAAAAEGETAATYAAGTAPAAAGLQSLLDAFDGRIASLESAVGRRPDHPRAWAELAIARLNRFGLARSLAGSSLGVVDLRLAAERGRFASSDEFDDWVRRATGDGYVDLQLALRDAVEAIRAAPLTGEAWCVVGNLGFLRRRHDLAPTCMAQAVRVRPASSLVLFESASQALIEGHADRATALWQASFAADARQRGRIVALLLPRMSSADACRLLEPDLDGLRHIEATWTPSESAAALLDVRARRLAAVLAAADASPPSARSRLLVEAAGLERRLGRANAARERLEAAIVADPASFVAHRALAEAAVATADRETARRELEWCLLRRPDSTSLKRMLDKLGTPSPATPAAGTRRAEIRPTTRR